VAGDFNVDGKLDLAVANDFRGAATGNVSVLMGNGNGTFQTAQNFDTGGMGSVSVVVGDFNRDGKPDLAVASESSASVSVLLGNGDGTFQTAHNFDVGGSPASLAVGDFNGDGELDLATANIFSDTASVLLGNGDGTFTSAPNSPLATGQSPTAVAIADFNGDGTPDFAVTDPQTDSVSVYLGLGQGLFNTPFELPVGTNPTAILAASLNGASLPDVAITDDPSGTAGQVTVILSPASLFSNVAGGGIAQQPYPGAEYEDLGVKIKATPTVHPNDEVTLQLEFEIRALAGSSINGIPVLTNRTISQTVRIKEGQPTIIAGLLDNQETKTITGLPGFARLPAPAGYLFGQRSTTAQDTEMLIMITPHKLRLTDRISRSIYVGRDTNAGRAAPAGVAVPSPRQPQ
jgi:hypothetical protein